MAGYKILKIDDLLVEQTSFKKPYERNFEVKLKNYISKFGQFETPIICQVDGEIKVVDHLNFALVMKDLGFTEINVYDIGEIKNFDFIAFRLFLNIKKNQLNHIDIAKTITQICKNKIDVQNLSNKTNLNEVDIEKYMKLLEFDWEEFARAPLGSTDDLDLFSGLDLNF